MYFTLTQIQFLVLAVLGGLLLVILVALAYWAWRLSLRKDTETDEETGKPEAADDSTEFPDGLREGRKPVPLIVTIVFTAILIWAVAYIIAVALGGIHVQ